MAFNISWDESGERTYETGVDRGVLYVMNDNGQYGEAVAWNGLSSVSESPSGAESNAIYADNIKYLDLLSAEEFGATVEAYTYPDEFMECDGTAEISAGVYIGQQSRKKFGFSYRTRIGDDLKGDKAGYKLHLIYGCFAQPSEKQYQTVSDSPEAIAFSWEIKSTPVAVGTIGGVEYSATSLVTIDSTVVGSTKMAKLEEILYGTDSTKGRLPLPSEIISILAA